MKSEQDEAYEKVLTANLARVLDMLKFAEAKNAALLAFASAWIAGLIGLLSSDKVSPHGFHATVALALPLFVVAALLAIASLLPKLSTSTFTGEPKGAFQNLLFFGDIAAITVEGFKLDVRARYMPTNGGTLTADYLDDLEGQISINSKIAKRKYKLFNIGAGFALIAIASFSVPIVGLIIDIVICCVRP